MDDPCDPIFSSLEYTYLPRNLYENPDGFLGRYAYSNEEKIGSKGSSTVITLYFENCYVASMVSPGGVVVVTPDQETWVRVPVGAFNQFFRKSTSKGKKKKDAHILICTFPFIATFVFLHSIYSIVSLTSTYLN